MLRLVLAVVGTLAGAIASALAADMPRSRPLPVPRAPTYVPFFTWNGLYVGINAGYGFGRSNWTDTPGLASTGNFNLRGPMVGGTLGYNLQFGTFVLGLEADLDWANIKGASANCFGTCQTANNWMGTARGRIGYAFDRFLPYVTAGAAFGDVEGTFGSLGSFKTNRVGWSGGGGLEYAFIDNWSAKLEYLYVDLGKATCDAACSALLAVDPVTVTFKTNILRAGLNYKF
jgi:outer membrane immunogenic protein